MIRKLSARWPIVPAALAGAVLVGGWWAGRLEDLERLAAAPIDPADLNWGLINRHRAHRPGECRDCDYFRDWQAVPAGAAAGAAETIP